MARLLHPQLQQLWTLLILFVLGKMTASIHVSWWQAMEILLFAGMVEYFFLFWKDHRFSYIPYSAFSTAIGTMLMLAASRVQIYCIAITFALAQKHFLRFRGRHFFNPSNFALMIAMVLFYDQAHVVLGQLGDELWLQVIVLFLAGLILIRVDRWMIALSFVVGYLLFEYIGVVGYDPVMTFSDVYQRFFFVSFIVFVAFMLTDPRTTPSAKRYQIIFGGGTALVAVWLDRQFGFRVQHLFMALFFLSPIVNLIEIPSSSRREAFPLIAGLVLLVIGVIMYLENQPPYYFEMEG